MVFVYELDGVRPVVDPSAFVHPTAVLIGDVIVGAGCYVGPGASLRGDFGRLVLGEGCNVQDNCIVHGYPAWDTVVGPGASVGHGAVLHCCTIGRNALVGMNAVVNDAAVVGDDAIVAALSFVKAEAEIPAGMLAAGVPARVLRPVKDTERAWREFSRSEYQRLVGRCRDGLRACDPLAAPEAGRGRVDGGTISPLHVMKGRRE